MASNEFGRLESGHSTALDGLRNPSAPWTQELKSIVRERQFDAWKADNRFRYYAYLEALVSATSPKCVLELGTKDGVSTLFIRRGLEERAQFITVDLNPNPRLLAEVEDDRMQFICGDDLDPKTISRIKSAFGGDRRAKSSKADRLIDFLFLDTEHTGEQLSRELVAYSPLLKPGAIVAVDDIHLNAEMEQWWRDLPYEKIDTGLMLHHSGFGLFEFQPDAHPTSEREDSRLAVLYFLHDDVTYHRSSIESFKEFGDIFAFISRTPWNGNAGDWEATQKIATASGATVELGNWSSECEQRQAAIRSLKRRGYSHALIPDGDEIIEPKLLRELKTIAEGRLADRVYVTWDTYWKSPEYVIRPREPFTPLILIDLENAFQLRLRDFGGGRSLFLGPEYGMIHHLSYCGPNERIARKIATWGHTNEVNPDWFEHVWSKWDGNRTMRNLHPTHPSTYGFAERIPLPSIISPAMQELTDASPAGARAEDVLSVPANWPTISVVIPAFGQSTLLEKCLESLSALSDLWHEVIVVDNASPDRTLSVLEQNPWVSAIENASNLGFAAACNQGLAAASGEIVMFLNSDTRVLRSGLIRLVESLTASNSIAAAGPFSNSAGHFQQTAVTYTSPETIELFADDFANRPVSDIETDMLSGYCLAARKSILDEVGGFDERFGLGLFEDNDLCYRLRRSGYRLVISGRSFVHHEGSSSIRNLENPGELFEANRIRYEKKWIDDLESGYASALSGLTADQVKFEPSRKPETLKIDLRRKAAQAKITICMIVRDEVRVIADCLRSVVDIFPDIVIVDTGSKDKTVEIARSFGAKVIESTWQDSFSAARNESIRAANGEWIFWIDADDTVPLASAEHLINEISQAPSVVHGLIVPVQFVDEGPNSGTRVDHVKAFRKLPNVQFEGRIHEQIIPSLKLHGGQIVRSRAVVLHSGYDMSEEGQARKAARDDKLLGLDLEERPDHPFPNFNMGMTMHYRGKHKKAVTFLKRSISLALPQDSHVRKSYVLMAQSYRAMRNNKLARKALIDGLAAAPGDPELHFNLAQLDCSEERFDEAIENYKKCLEADFDGHYSSVDFGMRSFKTMHNIGGTYELAGDHQSAIEWYRKAIEAAPTFLASAVGLFEVAMKEQDFALAREALEHIRSIEGFSELWAELGARFAERPGSTDPPTEFLARAVDTDPNMVGPRLSLCRRLLNEQRITDAIPHLHILSAKGSAEATYYLGVIAEQQGELDEALEYFERATRLNPDHQETLDRIEAIKHGGAKG